MSRCLSPGAEAAVARGDRKIARYAQGVLVLVGIGLLAGLVTAISPCVLPVLPILLAGGATGRKPFRIVAGLVGSFVVFTLFSTWLLNRLGLPSDLLRNLAIALLFVVAATLIVPRIGLVLERPFARLTRHRAGGGGFLLGVSLGLVFVPCAGPVLAAITVVAANNDVGLRAIVLTLAYAVGAALPMLLIAIGGRGIATRLRVQGPRLRLGSGIVIGLVALAIALNADSRFQTALPGYTEALQNRIENSSRAEGQLAKIRGGQKLVAKSTPLGGGLPNYGAAPALIPGGRWFNSPPRTLAGLRGKTVLIDFWTYSCINCLRTLPHLKAWYAAYHRDGFEIIGVHSPEFAFEHVAANVESAIKRLGIPWPVVQDNEFATWNAYQNQYWPAEYLIDAHGKIRHVSYGEGAYAETEAAIASLVGADRASAKPVADTAPTAVVTPESYLGYERLETTRYVGSAIRRNRPALYTAPLSIPRDSFAYTGSWQVGSQRIVAGKDAGLILHFHAKDVFLVLGGHGRVGVSIAGRPARNVDINTYRLYTLRSSNGIDDGLMQLSFTPGVQAYAFTFG
jgi:cytochrome c biogenesis protein CcdA/thiol-disulfide isomerase/thioredoxin